MTRSDDQIDDLELDIESAQHPATRILATPEDSLEFDPTPPEPSRVPLHYSEVAGSPPVQAEAPVAREIDWRVPAIPDAFGLHNLSLEPLLDLDDPITPESEHGPITPESEHGALELEPSIAPRAPDGPVPSRHIPGLSAVMFSEPPIYDSLAPSPFLGRDALLERGSSTPDPVIPELEVNAPAVPRGQPSSRPPSRNLGVRGGAANSPARPSSAPARASSAPAQANTAAIRASGAPPPRSVHGSRHPPSQGAYLGGDSSPPPLERSLDLRLPNFDMGDLDDLDFEGAPAAKFEMAVPPVQAEEVGWPVGRTPFDDQLPVEVDRIRQVAAFGPPPGSLVSTPAYAYRVFTGLRALRIKEAGARKALADAERARDEQLAQLAERVRSSLSENDRFRSLYGEAAARRARIAEHEKLRRNTDQQGAFELRNLQARLERLGEEELAKQRAVDEQQQRVAQIEREGERLRAHLKRLDIEERNLEEREERATDPAEFQAAFVRIEVQRKELDERLRGVAQARADAHQTLRQAEDELRRTTAERQACEGQKEGHMVALESELHKHSRGYDEAVLSHRDALAEIGRAIVELRGEIPVDDVTRKKLLAADDGVRYAATQLKVTYLARTSMDEDSYRRGKWLTVLLLVTLSLLLVSALAIA